MNQPSRHTFVRKIIFAAVLLLAVFAVSVGRAQNNPLIPPEDARIPDSLINGGKEKKARSRRPLESFYFDDSVKMRRVFSWQFSPYNNDVTLIEVDTLLYRFQLDYPYFYNTDVGSAYLGNLGAASIPLNFFLRPNYRDFSFLESFDTYLYTPDRARFFNVKNPFTQLAFYASGQKSRVEEQLRVLHAQNATPSLGFNIDYRNRGTWGMYTRQRAKNKALSLAASYSGRKYSVHGGYIYNMASLQENGGLDGDYQVRDTLIDLPENLIMNLADARTRYRGNTFYLTQSYGLTLNKLTEEDFSIAKKTTVFLGNSLEYTAFTKAYTGTRAGNLNADTLDFYENWYIHPLTTHDSIYESRLDAKFFTQFQPFNREGVLGTVSGGMGYTHHRYYLFQMEQYLNPTDGESKNSYYLYGSANGRFKEYISWRADAKYYMIGYRNQDVSIGGSLLFRVFTRDRRPVTLSFDAFYKRQTPDFWSENYFSNHFAWFNSFGKENETRLSARLTIESIGTELGAEQSAIQNKIYYDAQSLPQQYGGTLSLSGVYVRKDFRFGGLHLNNRVLLQWSSSQQVVPVPLASAYGSWFFEFNVVKNVLRMQLGVDAFYNTKYYAFAYNPALSRFYNQRQEKLGDYIWTDAFATGKWKQLRFVIKYQHLNYELFGGRNYFQVLHYPLNRRMFKIGISWGFYD